MTAMLTLLVLALVVALVARYGSDSRDGAAGGDPTGRDPAWPRTPTRPHSPTGDARRAAGWVAACARRVAAHQRAWDAYDRSLRVWESRAAR